MRLAGLKTNASTRVVESTSVDPESSMADPNRTRNYRGNLTNNNYDPTGVTKTFTSGETPDGGDAATNGGLGDWRQVEAMRQEAMQNMPLEKKLDMVLQRSKTAEQFAAQAIRGVEAFDRKLDQVFKNLAGMIERVAQGKPVTEPDSPGSSIWDGDNDPESIFGR